MPSHCNGIYLSCIIVFPALGLPSSCFSSRCCLWQIRLSVNRELGFYQSLLLQWNRGPINQAWADLQDSSCETSVHILFASCSFGVVPQWISAGTLSPAPRDELQGPETHPEPRACPGFPPQIRDSCALQLGQNCCCLLCQSSLNSASVRSTTHPAHKLLQVMSWLLSMCFGFFCTLPQDLHCGF